MVRIGVIGAGGIALGSCRDFAAHPEAEIVAVAEPNAERAAEFALRYDTVTQVVEEPERLLAIDEVDAVYVAVPNHLHAPLSALSLQAGKHVLQEKPLALSLEDAEQTAAAARAADTHFMLGMNQRFAAPVQRAKQLMEAGPDRPRLPLQGVLAAPRGHPAHRELVHPARSSPAAAGCSTSACTCWTTPSTCSTTSGRAPVSGATYTEFGNRGLGEGGWGMSARAGEQFDVDDFATAVIKLDGGATVLVEAAWAMHLDRTNDMNVELYGTEGAIDTYGERLSPAGRRRLPHYRITGRRRAHLPARQPHAPLRQRHPGPRGALRHARPGAQRAARAGRDLSVRGHRPRGRPPIDIRE